MYIYTYILYCARTWRTGERSPGDAYNYVIVIELVIAMVIVIVIELVIAMVIVIVIVIG